MEKEILIIDGYNVINAWPELIAVKEDLEYARDKLADIIVNHGAYKGIKALIVFDAHLVEGKPKKNPVNDMLEIVYTGEGQTADSYIEKTAYELVRQGWRVFVVTSDYSEQLAILGAGAYRVSARELRETVYKDKKHMKAKSQENEFIAKRNEIGNRLGDDVAKKLDLLRRSRR